MRATRWAGVTATIWVQLLRVGQSHDGLSRACATPDLDAVEQAGDPQKGELLLGEPVDGLLPLVRLRRQRVHRAVPAARDVDHELDVVIVGSPVVALLLGDQRPQALAEMERVVAAAHQPPRAGGQGEPLVDHGVGSDSVPPTEPAPGRALPPRVGLDVGARRIPGVARLANQVELDVLASAAAIQWWPSWAIDPPLTSTATMP